MDFILLRLAVRIGPSSRHSYNLCSAFIKEIRLQCKPQGHTKHQLALTKVPNLDFRAHLPLKEHIPGTPRHPKSCTTISPKYFERGAGMPSS